MHFYIEHFRIIIEKEKASHQNRRERGGRGEPNILVLGIATPLRFWSQWTMNLVLLPKLFYYHSE